MFTELFPKHLHLLSIGGAMSCNKVLSFTMCIRNKILVGNECKCCYVILKNGIFSQKNVISFWGALPPDLYQGLCPGTPLGARPPNSPYCSPTLNDLPPPVIKALSKYSVIIVIINLACKRYISVVIKGKVMPADDEQ